MVYHDQYGCVHKLLANLFLLAISIHPWLVPVPPYCNFHISGLILCCYPPFKPSPPHIFPPLFIPHHPSPTQQHHGGGQRAPQPAPEHIQASSARPTGQGLSLATLCSPAIRPVCAAAAPQCAAQCARWAVQRRSVCLHRVDSHPARTALVEPSQQAVRRRCCCIALFCLLARYLLCDDSYPSQSNVWAFVCFYHCRHSLTGHLFCFHALQITFANICQHLQHLPTFANICQHLPTFATFANICQHLQHFPFAALHLVNTNLLPRQSPSGLAQIFGALYSAVLFVGTFNAVAVMQPTALQRVLATRERGTSPSMFALAQSANEGLWALLQSVVFVMIYYWMLSFYPDFGKVRRCHRVLVLFFETRKSNVWGEGTRT